MTRPFEVGIAFQTDKTPAEYLALGELVDSFEFDVVSAYNDLFYQPALGPLLHLAQRVHRARLGPAALNPNTLHPVEIAGQIAVLDMATHGRAYLGLARGAWLDALGLPPERPIARLREAVLLVQHLLARRGEAFEGSVFRLPAGAQLQYAPLRSRVPVTIGTWGRQTAAIAAEVADEVKIGGSTNSLMAARMCAWLASTPVRVCLGAVTVVDRDRAAARALARRQVAMYVAVVAPLDVTLNDPEWLAHTRALAQTHDFEAIGNALSDEMLDRFAFSGTPGDILRQVHAIRAAGATRVEFGTPHGLDSSTGIRLLGAEVLPHIER
jgi:5,10-methylenetetrahydromethanopterin reductase